MSLEALMTMSVVIVHPTTTTNRYGSAEITWASASRTNSKAWIAQRNAREELDHRDAELSDWIAYLPPTTTVRARDRIEWSDGSLTFEVTGPPNPAHRPGTGVHHFEVPLRVVEG